MSRHARALTWAAIVAATTSAAQSVPSVRDEVDAYRDAIAAAESAATRGVESAFAAVVDLREALLALEPGGKQSILEGLSDIDIARVEQLPGVLIRRVEILVVHPDAEYFVTLATRVGVGRWTVQHPLRLHLRMMSCPTAREPAPFRTGRRLGRITDGSVWACVGGELH